MNRLYVFNHLEQARHRSSQTLDNLSAPCIVTTLSLCNTLALMVGKKQETSADDAANSCLDLEKSSPIFGAFFWELITLNQDVPQAERPPAALEGNRLLLLHPLLPWSKMASIVSNPDSSPVSISNCLACARYTGVPVCSNWGSDEPPGRVMGDTQAPGPC